MESGGTGPEMPDRGPQSPAPGPQSPATQVPPGGWTQPLPTGRPVKFASWWARVGAAIIDGLVIWLPAIVIVAILGVGAVASDDDVGVVGFVAGVGLTILVAAIVAIVYAPLLMARHGENNGQTWGKQVTNCRVVRADGEPYTFGTAAVREIAVKWLLFGFVGSFFFSLPTLVDWLWPLWDDQNRALHDFVVDSRVVETL